MTDKEALEAAYLAGFNASGEGYNGEYPFGDRSERPEQDKDWSAERDEFIKQALALDKKAENARELGLDYGPVPENLMDALRFDVAMRDAAQPAPVQEPLEYWNAVEGWVKIDEVREHFNSVGCGTIYKTAGEGRVPLTAAQRQWQGLTDEDFENAFQETYIMGDSDLKDFAKVIEAKLKEKNT